MVRVLLAALVLAAAYGASAASGVVPSGAQDDARRLRLEFNALLAMVRDASEREDPLTVEWAVARIEEVERLRDAVELLPDPPGRPGGSDRAVRYYRSALNRLDAAVRELAPFAPRGLLNRFASQELIHRAEEQWDQAEELYRR